MVQEVWIVTTSKRSDVTQDQEKSDLVGVVFRSRVRGDVGETLGVH